MAKGLVIFSLAIIIFQVFGSGSVQAQGNETDSQPLTKWSVKAGNITCVLITGSFEIKITKTDTNGVVNEYNARIPQNAKSNGTCGAIAQDITLTWPSNSNGNTANINNGTKPAPTAQSSLQFKFWKECNYAVNMSVCTYKLGAISGTIQAMDSNGNSTSQYLRIPTENINYNMDDINTSCNITTDTLTAADGSTTLRLDNFMVQAFRSTPDQTFSDNVVLCAPPAANVGVWIGGVAAALIIISAIALAAYFIIKKKRLSYTAMP